MFEIVLILAAAVCIVDILWMYRAQRRAAALAADQAPTAPIHGAILRRLVYYAIALAVMYSFGDWMNLSA